MKKVLMAFLCTTAIIPLLSALTIVPRGGINEDLGRIQEATDKAVAELDSDQGNYYNVANLVHSRITEVTNDTRDDHQLIRMHWTANAEVWVWAFKLRFTYFDENRKPIKTERRWMCCPNEDGSLNLIPPHSPIDEWHELTVPTEEANKLKSVTVAVELAYESEQGIATGYTVPSAGSQVLLHNGQPLYGPGGPPSFAPIMRQTNAVIDQAGNVWTINNQKPDFDIDVLSNPGGDGIVIFVGLAAPPAKH